MCYAARQLLMDKPKVNGFGLIQGKRETVLCEPRWPNGGRYNRCGTEWGSGLKQDSGGWVLADGRRRLHVSGALAGMDGNELGEC